MIPPSTDEISGLKEILTTLMVGGLLSLFKAEMNIVMRVFIGIMVLWYIIDITQRIEIFIGERSIRMDLQLWYIIVDFTTFAYLFIHGFLGTLKTKPYRFLIFALGVWYLRYLGIDIMDAPAKQNNQMAYHFLIVLVDAATIFFMLWTELVLYKRENINKKKKGKK